MIEVEADTPYALFEVPLAFEDRRSRRLWVTFAVAAARSPCRYCVP